MSAEKDYSNAEDITDVGENDIDEDEKDTEVDVVQETCYEYKQRRYEERLVKKKE